MTAAALRPPVKGGYVNTSPPGCLFTFLYPETNLSPGSGEKTRSCHGTVSLLGHTVFVMTLEMIIVLRVVFSSWPDKLETRRGLSSLTELFNLCTNCSGNSIFLHFRIRRQNLKVYEKICEGFCRLKWTRAQIHCARVPPCTSEAQTNTPVICCFDILYWTSVDCPFWQNTCTDVWHSVLFCGLVFKG